MNIWSNYKKVLHETFPLHGAAGSVWAQWEGKGTSLLARTYTNQYFIKAREVEIWNDKSCIYNNIIYPKTGSNLPCFGMVSSIDEPILGEEENDSVCNTVGTGTPSVEGRVPLAPKVSDTF